MGSPNIGNTGMNISIECSKCGSKNIRETFGNDYDCVYVCGDCGLSGDGKIYLESKKMFFVSIKNALILRQAIHELYKEISSFSDLRNGTCDVTDDIELIDEYDFKEVTKILSLPKEEQLQFQNMNILVSSATYNDTPLDIRLIESAFKYEELTTYEEIFEALHENLNPLYTK